jgi:hypothetical protein
MLTDKKPQRASPAELAHIDELLDEALNQTFPASDPVAINIERGSNEHEVSRVRVSRSAIADGREAERTGAGGTA